jgi:hypothetical protein
MREPKALTALLGTLVVGLLPRIASAAPAAPLRIDKVDKAPVIDGAPGEWQRELGRLSQTVKGSPSAADLSAKGAVSYDDKSIYVAVDVTDDVLVGGGSGDRVDLVIMVGSSPQTVSLFPGQPGKSAGKATSNGAAISGAKVVEAPRKGGYSLEASIPWSAFDGASNTRVGLKGGLFVSDSDAGSTVDATVGTAGGTDSGSLGPLLTTPEQSLADGLIKDKKLGAPSFSMTANVVGDGMRERVLVFDRFLVVLGPTYRGGKEYYFADMGVSGHSLSVQKVETRDIDGDGRDEIVFTKRFTKSGAKTTREVMHISSYGTADTPEIVFQHEVGITNAKGSINNEVSFGTDAGKVALTIRPGSAKGLEEKTYDEPTESSFDALLLPWGSIESQTYKWKGKGMSKVGEKTRAKPAGEAPKVLSNNKPEAPKAPPPPAKVDSAKVYAQYKKDRSIKSAAQFDVSGDVSDGSEAERVVQHDREIAVFGPGHKNGSGYSFLTLAFASASDVKSVSLRDVTGDKKSEIVVRGILKSKGPKQEDVEREVELVFRVTSEGMKRVFGAEVGRSIGSNKIVGSISYDASSVKLAPGKAVGFTEKTYPFNQDSGPVGGLEPLLLPWGNAKPATYKWSGSAFDKK